MISIVLPTKDRSPFAIRTLRYYAENGFQGAVLVGDSSGPEHRARMEAYLRGLGSRLNVVYRACPELNERETLRLLSRLVETRYAAFVGDDDFLLLPGLEACARFLEGHADFVAANGKAWAFYVRPPAGAEAVHGTLEVHDAYPQPDLQQPDAAARLSAHLADYRVTLFSLHRADAWREMWEDTPSFDDKAFGAELYPCCLSPVLGKLKTLDGMYLLRQSHEQRYLLPGAAAWMGADRWRANYERFRDLLAERLGARAGMAQAEAARLVEEGFVRGYLARFPERDRLFPWAAQARAPKEEPSMSRQAFRRLLAYCRRARMALPAGAAGPALPSYADLRGRWLDPASPEHHAFAPVDRLISMPAGGSA